MTSHKAVVEACIEGFRRTGHEAILACLTDDIVWVLQGYRTLRGKEAFDGELENDAAVGSPTLYLDRLIEEGDTVVAVGSGEMTLKEADPVAFVFSEVFTFTGDKISRLETFHINVDGPDDTLLRSRPAETLAAGASDSACHHRSPRRGRLFPMLLGRPPSLALAPGP